jgi:hypothetical protein
MTAGVMCATSGWANYVIEIGECPKHHDGNAVDDHYPGEDALHAFLANVQTKATKKTISSPPRNRHWR